MTCVPPAAVDRCSQRVSIVYRKRWEGLDARLGRGGGGWRMNSGRVDTQRMTVGGGRQLEGAWITVEGVALLRESSILVARLKRVGS